MTGQKEVVEVSAIIFICRMVQHILHKGFQRVRHYGLHATCKANKVAKKLSEIFAEDSEEELVRRVNKLIRRGTTESE